MTLAKAISALTGLMTGLGLFSAAPARACEAHLMSPADASADSSTFASAALKLEEDLLTLEGYLKDELRLGSRLSDASYDASRSIHVLRSKAQGLASRARV